MKVILAEKPSVARELARHVGANKRRDGWLEGKGYQVTWAFGHLAALKTPDEYDPALKRWTLESLPFIPERFELKVDGDATARKQFKTIEKLFRGADSLVCATDAGREGELIFRYIVALAGCEAKPAERLWLSAMTTSAIREAFDHLRPAADYDALYAAARSRSEADWIVGLNATRNYTVRFGAGGVLWSVGRVQTPVLAMIVGRDDEIRHFRPKAYWELFTHYRGVKFSFAGKGTRAGSGAHERHGFATEDDARAVLARAADAPLVIGKVTEKEEREHPPRLFDLTSLQRDMNRQHGMSAQATLDAAQELYEKKLITYPRTDSRHLPADMHESVRNTLEQLSRYRAAEIGRLDLSRLSRSRRMFDDGKVTDHHAIIPTGQLPGGLSIDRQRVLDAVVTRLIAVFYPPCVKAVTLVDAKAATVPFRTRGTRVVEPGWTSLYPSRSSPKAASSTHSTTSAPAAGGGDQQALPAFEKGESGPHEPAVEKKETKPPRPFNEASLLGAMETAGRLVEGDELREALKDKGLGTPATRASIIETLLKRGYVERDKKTLRATDLGRYLIAIIADPQLKSPEMTGEWEAKLKGIEKGTQDASLFKQEITRYIGDLVRRGLPAVRSNVLGDCPRCGAPVIEGKRSFGCSGWREGCGFVLPAEHRGVALDAALARELLQRRIVIRPASIDGTARVLRLTAQGVVEDLEAPSRDRQHPGGRGGAATRTGTHGRRGKKPANRSNESGGRSEEPGNQHKGPAGRRATVEPGNAGSQTRRVASGEASVEPLCDCPQCGRPIVESEKGFGCSGWREGCRVTVWKTIAGKKITRSMATKVLTRGKTQVLKGFVAKSGKAFEARLVWREGKVGFEFH